MLDPLVGYGAGNVAVGQQRRRTTDGGRFAGGDLRRARVAVLSCFVVHGLLLASWTPRIPSVKEHLALSDGVLGLALLGLPVGALVAMPITGAISARYGSKHTLLGGLAIYLATAPLAGVAGSAWELSLALLAWGIGVGSTEVALNVQATAVETAYGRPIMATFHGGWSIGALAGTLVGSGFAALHTGLTLSLALTSCAGAATAALAARMLPTARGAVEHPFARPTRALLALGAIAFASYLVEGAVADWSAVYLRTDLAVGAGLAGFGYAAFAFAMTVGRMGGARVVGRFGPSRTIEVVTGFGAVALAVALGVGRFPVAVAGCALFGLGLSVVVPTVLSEGARRAGPSGTSAVLAALSTCGIAGYLLGPPVIGGLASAISLPVALGLLPLLAAVIAVLARTIRPPA